MNLNLNDLFWSAEQEQFFRELFIDLGYGFYDSRRLIIAKAVVKANKKCFPRFISIKQPYVILERDNI